MSTHKPLQVVLIGASIRREMELPGYEHIRDFASESFNLAIATLEATLRATPELRDRVEISRFDFAVSFDRAELGEAELDAVLETKPDFIGLSCYSWSLDALLDFGEALCRHRPEAFLVLGGPSAGPAAEQLLRSHSFVDAVASGEGERTLVALVRAQIDGGSLSDVPGLVSRDDASGKPVESERSALVDLAELPSPYQQGLLEDVGDSMLLETSRGCRYRCRFCSWMGGGGPLRYVPLEAIAADLQWALDHGIRSIKIADTAINFDTDRLSGLAATVGDIDRDRRLRFTYFLKPELLDRDQANILKDLPADEVIVGVESVDNAVRKAAGKPSFSVEELEEKLSWLSDVGPVTASIILGLPGDTVSSLSLTIERLLEIEAKRPGALHVVCLFWLALLPGSKMERQRDRYVLRTVDRGTPYVLESAYSSPDELLEMAREAATHHYRHPIFRLEHFHKIYLQQDAPSDESAPRIERVLADDRRVIALVSAPVEVAGENECDTPSLDTAFIKAFIERDKELRKAFRLELVTVERSPGGGLRLLKTLEALEPELLLWWNPPVTSIEFRRCLSDLRARTRGREPTVVVGGITRGSPVSILKSVTVIDAVIEGEGELPVRALLERLQSPMTSLDDVPGLVRMAGSGRVVMPAENATTPVVEPLDDIPSPFQWGFVPIPVPRHGCDVAMQLGRRRGEGASYFSWERLEADVRWAVEERHERIFWTGAPLPDSATSIRALFAAFKRADPTGALVHVFELSTLDVADDETFDALLSPPRSEMWVPPDQRLDPERLRRLERVDNLTLRGATTARHRDLGRTEAVLLAWRERGVIAGWSLETIESRSSGLELVCRRADNGVAQVLVRSDDAHSSLEVTLEGTTVREQESAQLMALIRRLVVRASVG